MEKLFLIRPDFQDKDRNDNAKYFCPPCALIEGVLTIYPQLREKMEVQYVNFQRPRPSIIQLIGEENQSCPVLILSDKTFINEPEEILKYFAKAYGIGNAH